MRTTLAPYVSSPQLQLGILRLLKWWAKIEVHTPSHSPLTNFELTTFEFNNKNYAKSAEIYLQASRFDPTDPSYLENAGHSLYLLNDKSKAKMLFDSVITYYPNTKGKAYYFKGLMLIESKSSLEESCRMFSISLKRGYSDAQKAINLFCK